MTRYEEEIIGVKKESLEVLFLNYIFSNLEKGSNRTRYAGEAFSKLSKDNRGNLILTVEYKVFTEYTFEDGEKEYYNDVVQIALEGGYDYSKEDLNVIKEDMYLNSINDVAFIINILKNVKF